MSEPQEQFGVAEEDYDVDPITGEILDIGRPGIEGGLPEQLSQIGRWIDGRHESLKHLDNPQVNCFCKGCMQAREYQHIIDRLAILTALRDKNIARHKEKIGLLEEWAKGIMDEAGKDKVTIPGVGKFAYRGGSESVDTVGFDSLDQLERYNIQEDHPELFHFKITPNKGMIKQNIHDTEGNDIYGFTLKRGPDTFGFTRDK